MGMELKNKEPAACLETLRKQVITTKKKKNPETEVTLIYSKEAKKSKTKEEIRFTGEVGRVKFISLQFA